MTAATLPAATEKEWMATVVDLARVLGWEVYHPWLSIHSPRGWPDLSLCRPPRLIVAELKTARGKVRPDQVRWLGLLGDCPGVETYLWRPYHLDVLPGVLGQSPVGRCRCAVVTQVTAPIGAVWTCDGCGVIKAPRSAA